MGGPVAADVVEVIDGDTLRVSAHIWLGQRLETLVRLGGIDAPELHGRCEEERRMALAARKALARAAGTTVLLFDVDYGKYAGRVTARVSTTGGQDLSALMLASGLARPYAGGARSTWCARTP